MIGMLYHTTKNLLHRIISRSLSLARERARAMIIYSFVSTHFNFISLELAQRY